ncbi:MAG: hypothetical protein ACRCZM_08700, partial [Bacteroidales bacterium]
ILLINGVPYPIFVGHIVAETLTLSNSIQLSTQKNGIPIVTPVAATVDITVELPMDSPAYAAGYKVAKEIIRSTQHIFATSNSVGDSAEKKLTIPFTKLKAPWEVQVSCAYFGVGANMACCILEGFSVSTSPSVTGGMETWQITLTEYNFRQVEAKEEAKKAVSLPNTDFFGGFN